MNYNKLFCIFPWAFFAALIINGFICGFKQILIELRGEYNTNTDGLYIILLLPLWIIISFIFYYIFI